MVKSLVIHPDKCTGCYRCVIACSYVHTGKFSVGRSRIQISKVSTSVNAPIACIQCGLCIPSCPVNAIGRNPRTQAVVIDEEKCISCGFCVNACPYGTVYLDPKTNKAIKCDLCGGDPECVKTCPFEAIAFEDSNSAAERKRKAFAVAISREVPGLVRKWV